MAQRSAAGKIIAIVRTVLWVWPMIVAVTVVFGLASSGWALVRRDIAGQLRIARSWARTILSVCGIRVTVTGMDRIDPNTSYVFVPNHQSYMDTPAILAHLPNQFLFLAKSSLFYVPFLGWHLSQSGHVRVPEGDARESLKSLTEAARLIRQGRSTLIFAEGERSLTGEMSEFKDGAAVVAIRAQVPLVPIAIRGAREILARHSRIFYRGRIDVEIGDPIPTEGLTIRQRAELTATARDAIAAMLSSFR